LGIAELYILLGLEALAGVILRELLDRRFGQVSV
jgi:hypothetical protein